MKKFFTSVVLAMSLLGAATSARADSDWYAALDIGRSHFGTIPSGLNNNTDTGYDLAGGRELNQNFAVEAGFITFGKGVANSCLFVNIPCYGGGQTASIRAEAVSIDAIGKIPLGDGLTLFGRFGLDTGRVHVDVYSTANSSTNSGFNWGLGAAYQVTETWGLRVQFMQFQNLGDDRSTRRGNFSLTSLGVSYTF